MHVIKYASGHGNRVGLLVTEGRKFIQIILMDSSGIKVKKVPLASARFINRLDYNLNSAKRKFRAAGRRFGITKSAKKALRG